MSGAVVFLGSASKAVVISSLALAGVIFLVVLYNEMRVRTVTFRRTIGLPIVLVVIAL